VEQNVDEVKTRDSRRTFAVAPELLAVLGAWRQASQFSADEDWMFASPLKIGRLPYSYTGVWRELKRAAQASGIGDMATHAFRHTYRTWLDPIGMPIGVQQRLMRHADIRTTMNQYGDALTADMQQAQGKVIQLVLKST
jgi:integrase